MFKQFVQDIGGTDAYMVASLIIFVTFFIGVGIWLIKADKSHLKEASEIPLKPDTLSKTEK